MNPRAPSLRIRHPRLDALVFREGLDIFFHMPHPHRRVAKGVRQCLELYLHAVGFHTLTCYPDEQGDFQDLDAAGWQVIHQRLHDEGGGLIELRETPEEVSGYGFEYRGLHPLDPATSALACTVAFRLPTEFLEAKGPSAVRDLALEMGHLLPFNSGHAGYAFHYLSLPPDFPALALRYPGIDHLDLGRLTHHLGNRIHGAHWLTFLGPPVLESLGGSRALRDRLHAPDTSVRDLDSERALISLGEGPEAGDTTQGDHLPAYRELARLLDPWRYQRPSFGMEPQEEADLRRWERRFLD